MAKAAKKASAAASKKAATKGASKAAPAPKKAAAKKSSNKGGATGNGGGKANPAFMAPLTPSADLAKVVGKEPIPRTEIIKRIWDYIKSNNLQDSNNRRMINGDEKLKVVFGGKEQVSMFELAKIVNGHVKK
jgi:chromatin remodeling complex protein RSC6